METVPSIRPRARTVALPLVVLSTLGHRASAQDSVRVAPRTVITGAFTVTNKGISTIPSFTLGKPAAILDVFIIRRGLSFDPQFKVGLDGKPWSFVFWGRYDLPDRGRLHVTVGAHPAVSFRTLPVTTNGVARDVIVARRYLAGEIAPVYALSRHAGVGPYYLYSHAIENDVARNTHFLAARAYLTGIRVSQTLAVRIEPQLYYLRTDDRDGYYAYSGISLAKAGFPLSILSVVNQPLRTNVPGGDDFIWNVSARYAFR